MRAIEKVDTLSSGGEDVGPISINKLRIAFLLVPYSTRTLFTVKLVLT